MKNFDLNILKKKYGEKFAKMCRMLFPDFLEEKGFLSEIITSNFAESKVLYDDIKYNKLTLDFKNFVFSFMPVKEYDKSLKNVGNPFELMKKAGYTLHKCETNEEVLQFKKFWKEDEELCTFRDNLRVNDNMVFFAVRDGAEKINREDFSTPKRQDDYGTSVICIQISKSKPNTISILNRYNHSVRNPDSTFSNNLENIIDGLTNSFVEKFNLNLDAAKLAIDWPDYFKAADGKFYRYTYERLDYRFCPDNVYIDPNGKVIRLNKDRYVLFDYFILDTKDKTVKDVLPYTPEGFSDTISDIAKTQIIKDGENKQIILTNHSEQEIVITLNKYSAIIKYHNPAIKTVPDFFLINSSPITDLSLPNVVSIGSSALMFNETIKNVYLPKLETVGGMFLKKNNSLTELNLPNLKSVGTDFLKDNKVLKELNAPKLKITGYDFLESNEHIDKSKYQKPTYPCKIMG